MRFLQYLFDLLLLNLLFYSTIPTPLNKKVTPECIQFPATEPYSVSQANFLSNIDTLTIPLKRAGKLLLIETHIDGQHGNLIFDTGASNLVLNNTYFRDYLRTESVTPNGITGSLGKIYKTIVDTLKINGLFYHDIKADLADLGHIENRRGVKVLGLLGLNLFRDYEVIINAKHNELKLLKIDKKGNRVYNSNVKFCADYSQTISEENSVVFINGSISNKSLKFCFDTGAEINAIGNSENKAVLGTISVTRRSKLGGAGSAVAEVLYGVMNDFTFGEKRLDGMQTIITNLSSLEEGYGVSFNGVLGCDFLERGTICINLRKKEFGIRFNKAEVE